MTGGSCGGGSGSNIVVMLHCGCDRSGEQLVVVMAVVAVVVLMLTSL